VAEEETGWIAIKQHETKTRMVPFGHRTTELRKKKYNKNIGLALTVTEPKDKTRISEPCSGSYHIM